MLKGVDYVLLTTDDRQRDIPAFLTDRHIHTLFVGQSADCPARASPYAYGADVGCWCVVQVRVEWGRCRARCSGRSRRRCCTSPHATSSSSTDARPQHTATQHDIARTACAPAEKNRTLGFLLGFIIRQKTARLRGSAPDWSGADLFWWGVRAGCERDKSASLEARTDAAAAPSPPMNC